MGCTVGVRLYPCLLTGGGEDREETGKVEFDWGGWGGEDGRRGEWILGS